ncbi:hypothetical protein C8T65DRAFT_630848 [Cerioporus squamosus]|nr:hypothetical protein C8T65DRAFT_630848 [Cerioporus squamosus]
MTEALYNTAGALLSYIPYLLSTSPTSPASAPPLEPRPALPYASQNLRHYVGTAIIPDMVLAPTAQSVPEAGRKSHANHLKVQHESYRVLESMQRIDHFGALARKFSERILPADPTGSQKIDPDITVPAPGYDAFPRHERPPNKLQNIVAWVNSFPLGTIHRIMQLVYPAALSYDLTVEQDFDGALIQWIKWAPDEDTITESRDLAQPPMTVFVQAPWVLSEKDLEVFAKTPVFPKGSLSAVHYRSVHRLWGKIYDVCSRNRSHYFVVTTYWGWVFGAFSAEYTRAWVSEVIPSSSQDPTILQCLFYWFASALGHPNRWRIPMVPEPLQDDHAGLDLPQEQYTVPSLFVAPPPSESEWTARSGARSHTPSGITSDDDGDTVMDVLAADRENEPRRIPMGRSNQGVAEWQGKLRAPSPAPSEASTATSFASTVWDYAETTRSGGSWMHGRQAAIMRDSLATHQEVDEEEEGNHMQT